MTASADFVLPLDLGGTGPRVAVKDVIDVAGTPTRAGSRAFADRAPAPAHAEVVRRILAAGCRIVGKANLHELAFGMTGLNGWTGTPVNPSFPHLVPGGSSSGSATAVAAGLCDWALGTDTGGSIRVPAACCGIVGFKPSFGRLSRAGLTPADSSLDCVGPLARNVRTVVAAMAVLDPGFVMAVPDRPARVGIVRPDADAAVTAEVLAAVERSGCVPVEVALTGLREAHEAGMTIMNAEMSAAFHHLLGTDGLGPDIEARLRRAATIEPGAVRAGEAVRARFRAEVDGVLDAHRLDAVAMPTLPGFPVRLSDANDAAAALAMSRLVRPFNLSGHPALSLPVAVLADGPVSLQLVGRLGDDALVCAVGETVEARQNGTGG